MIYTHHLIRMARLFGQTVSLERNDESNKYSVSINLVTFKDNYLRKPVKGTGFTIEDACYDFIRLCRGGYLIHSITDQEIEVI